MHESQQARHSVEFLHYQVKYGWAKLWVETERNHIPLFGAPQWSPTDGHNQCGLLGLALEILSRRHSATNLLGVQRKSNHAMEKLLLRRKWKVCSQLPWDGCWRERGAGGETCPSR